MQEKRNKAKVLITGSNGQLGQCLKKIEKDYPTLDMYFTDSKALDITQKDQIDKVFSGRKFDFVVNCAAFTNVERAEKESERAFLINAEGVKNLAELCREHGAVLIHISTDYVFDGRKGAPYTEEDIPNPINEYGKSKLEGEKYVQEILEKYFIIRTSWLYSEFGNNFFTTILKKSKSEKKLKVTMAETGTPTNANDLANFILHIINLNSSKYGIYHFSSLGKATWYDFAEEILRLSGKLDTIKLEKTDNYPTFARRPKYSVLDKKKFHEISNLNISKWPVSLRKLLKSLQ
ncbi:dTDP-4-dehydrorhamnose reductase [Aquimarina sp. U1-2]|uniref:dTDP-4-dehydrorhamnose reductase n=1 Tax=Aquimarina sp. U1-2 TaxID=2823141 RepID=UPI001AEC89B0|nr:dTDP-4-dehydrorhamnose reductase [Aquimarina sp. U1-2]MBP2833872.1 dTDP-4-dehydrorhamnose reductase [Aquimarina sp. U1-2]